MLFQPLLKGEQNLKAIEVAHMAVEIATDKQAIDIVLLDVRGIATFADFFIVCSGQSNRQINAIYDEILYSLKKKGVLPRHREGTTDSGWLLIDYGDVIIHIFAPNERTYYKLDELWSQASPMVVIQ